MTYAFVFIRMDTNVCQCIRVHSSTIVCYRIRPTHIRTYVYIRIVVVGRREYVCMYTYVYYVHVIIMRRGEEIMTTHMEVLVDLLDVEKSPNVSRTTTIET